MFALEREREKKKRIEINVPFFIFEICFVHSNKKLRRVKFHVKKNVLVRLLQLRFRQQKNKKRILIQITKNKKSKTKNNGDNLRVLKNHEKFFF